MPPLHLPQANTTPGRQLLVGPDLLESGGSCTASTQSAACPAREPRSGGIWRFSELECGSSPTHRPVVA
jgi:hypothetical protein